MATHKPEAHTISMVAADDLSDKQYHFVALGTSTKTGKVVLAATAGMYVLGVLLNKPKAEEEALIQWGGIAKVKVGASDIAANAIIACGDSTSSGMAITATAGAVSGADVTGSNVLGQYLGSAAGAAGAIVEVLLKPTGVQP